MIRERDPRKPLFLYVPFNAVHGPYQVPDSYLEPYPQFKGTRQKYAGMVAAMDEAIGQIVAALDEAGIRDNTLILFSSDNGGPSPGTITDNGPLRAGKGTIYEGGVRVCALANWPGHVKAGTVVKEPIHIVDLFPTLVTLAGGSLKQKLPLDGADVWPTITLGAKSPHDAILLCQSPTRAAVRVGDWKLMVGAGAADEPAAEAAATNAGAKKKGKKNAKVAAGDSLQLFNLKDDVGEKQNLAAQQPEKLKELETQLRSFLNPAVKPGNPDEQSVEQRGVRFQRASKSPGK